MTGPRIRIEYARDWRDAPMAYWVHLEPAGEHWRAASAYAPPAPVAEGRRGFRVLVAEIGAHDLSFSSPAQLDEAIRVLSLKPLPSTRRLTQARHAHCTPPSSPQRANDARKAAALGPNSHWLSRLPASLKSAKGRGRVVEALRAARAATVRGDRFEATDA